LIIDIENLKVYSEDRIGIIGVNGAHGKIIHAPGLAANESFAEIFYVSGKRQCYNRKTEIQVLLN